MTTELKQFHTACRGCVFAVNDHFPDGDKVKSVQTGCSLGRLLRYVGQQTVIEAHDEDNNEFYIINGRICNAFRDEKSDWAKQHEADPVTQAKKELKLRMTALVLVDEGKSVQDAMKTAGGLVNQTVPPVETFFVVYGGQAVPAFHSVLWMGLGNNLTWRITNITDPESRERGRAIDLAVSQAKLGNWYTTFSAGYIPQPDFIEKVHIALNERLERFSLLTTDESGNGLVVQMAMHKHPYVCGNTPVWASYSEEEQETPKVYLGDVAAKIQHYAKVNEQPYMVRALSEVLA